MLSFAYVSSLWQFPLNIGNMAFIHIWPTTVFTIYQLHWRNHSKQINEFIPSLQPFMIFPSTCWLKEDPYLKAIVIIFLGTNSSLSQGNFVSDDFPVPCSFFAP